MAQKIIGNRIQEIRKNKGLTQEQLAEQIEISPHYLSALERGVYNIKLELLVKMLNALDCSADEAFQDVVKNSSKVRSNLLSEKLNVLPLKEQKKIYEVIDTMIQNASN